MESYRLQTHRKRISCLKIIGVVLLIIIIQIIISLITYSGRHCELKKEITENHSSLIFVQVVVRHGERTPMIENAYPNDPYKNETYEPHGSGTLTSRGEKSMYDVGKFLSEYYQEYLGDYHRDIVYAQSSPLPRCFRSLLLILAGLFPPSANARIDNDLNWRAIPYYYNPIDSDLIFLYFVNCKKYVKQIEKLCRKIILDDEVKGIRQLIQYLEYYSGANITSISKLFELYDHLNVQHALGYKLPLWADKIYPEPLRSFSQINMDLPTRSDILRKLSGGFLLKRLIEDISLKVQNSPRLMNRKIHIYSGHDFTIVNLLGTLGFKLSKNPNYSSFLSLEVHRINGSFSVRLLYQDHTFKYPKVIKLPECEELCPLEQFLELYGRYQATPEECDS